MQPTEHFMRTVLGKVDQMQQQVIAMSSMMGGAFQGIGQRFNNIEHCLNQMTTLVFRKDTGTRIEGMEDIAHRFDEMERWLQDIKEDTRMKIVPEDERSIKEQVDYIAAQLEVLREAHLGLGRLMDERLKKIEEKLDGLALQPQFGQTYGFSLD